MYVLGYTDVNIIINRIDDVMVSVLTSSVVDLGIYPRSGQTKDYKIGFIDIGGIVSPSLFLSIKTADLQLINSYGNQS
jgi:hypothetical protein